MKRCKCPATNEAAVGVVHALQAAKISKTPIDRDSVEKESPWYINSEEHNYCFWELNKELHGSPMSNKEIANLLVMTQDELEATFQSAILKLHTNRNEPDIKDFLELIQERINTTTDTENNSVYMPSNFREKIKELEHEEAAELEKENEANPKRGRGRPKKKMNNLPLHRDGRKVDLFGLNNSYRIAREIKKKQ